MSYGSTNKILRVDLTSRRLSVQELDDDFYRLYPGGKALAGYFMLTEMPAHVDPFAPENLLVIANGLLTGTPLSTATRYVVSARSPLTGTYGESEAAGYFGPELKMAGFEAILVTGRADTPVYLWVHDGEYELRPAGHLWGRHPHEVQAQIRSELDDEKIRVLQIGIAGENLVRYASITNDLRHFNGRNGMGTVMGSKNLKAVAVRGHARVQSLAYDTPGLMALGRRLAQEAQKHPQSVDLQVRGTLGVVEALNAGGILPTRNFLQGAFEGVDGLKWEAYEKQVLTARRTCYACAVRCKREAAVNGRVSEYGGPEYETVAAFGSNCAISDLPLIARANELCNMYLIDTISAGATIAFAMECFEHGLIGLKETGGIDLRFGNGEAVLAMIEQIAKRQGLGALLSEGSKRAAEVIGGEAPLFTIEVKGQELAMHDPRGKYNLGLGYAICENGADHLVVPHDPMLANPESVSFKGARGLGITEARPSRSLDDEKLRQFFILERLTSLEKTIGFCFFGPAPRSFIQPEDMLLAINLATGWGLDMEAALRIGERGTNLARLFNAREGFTARDDRLPERLFQGAENGALQGQPIPRQEFQEALHRLYLLKGWDPENGMPLPARLNDLSLGWAADISDRSIPLDGLAGR
jgi:aldehyde:ferredoxin oxidoreductase